MLVESLSSYIYSCSNPLYVGFMRQMQRQVFIRFLLAVEVLSPLVYTSFHPDFLIEVLCVIGVRQPDFQTLLHAVSGTTSRSLRAPYCLLHLVTWRGNIE